ncbi:MAG: hypothetical protein P8X74_23635, partial [Reinekea sp.]
SSLLPKNFNEPMGAPAIFEKQIEIKLLHPASTLESRIQVKLLNKSWNPRHCLILKKPSLH